MISTRRVRRPVGDVAANRIVEQDRVLGDDADRAERGGGAEDRADIVRVGNLIEHQQDGTFGGLGQQVAEPQIVERLDLDHHALVRRVGRDHAAEVGAFGPHHHQILGEVHQCRGLKRGPRFQHPAIGIVERRRNRMLAPETRPVRVAATSTFVLARHGWTPSATISSLRGAQRRSNPESLFGWIASLRSQ